MQGANSASGMAWIRLDTDPPTVPMYMCPYCGHVTAERLDVCPKCKANMWVDRRCGNCGAHPEGTDVCLHPGKDTPTRIWPDAPGREHWMQESLWGGKEQAGPRKPPIGVMPEYLWKKKRYNELCAAIGRYVMSGPEPLPEWIEEGKRLEAWLESQDNSQQGKR